jgi:acetyltransferase
MVVARAVSKSFSAERLLAPRSLALVGAETRDGARLLQNLRAARFTGTLHVAGAACAELPEGLDVALLALSDEPAAAALRVLADRKIHAVIATAHVAGLADIAASLGVRLLGPNSFGLFVAKRGLNASLAHIQPPRGRVALLTQSASFARAVIDWAGPNGVGFSHIVGIGENSDIGFGTVLDYLSRDPDTGLILLDIRQVRARRAFISAARAASRLRPTVAIRPGGRLVDPSGRADTVFAAALHRAGVFTVASMEEFLAAAETFSRACPARGEAVAIVTNAIGPGRLAADAALRAGISLAHLPKAAQSVLPAELTQGLVYAGTAAPMQVADLAAMLSAVPDVGGVLVLLAPTGPGDAAAVEAVIAAACVAKLPVLTCVMGETTAAAHRRRIAEAGFPVFATPEQTVTAFHHLLRDRAARLAARELPPSRVLEVAPDHAAAACAIAAARAAGRKTLTGAETAAILAAYGIDPARARISMHEDGIFGPAIGLTGGDGTAYDLPPLNLPLARALARRAGAPEDTADTLVRISQLIVDEPRIASLHLGAAPEIAGPEITVHPSGERGPLAIPPYPEELIETWQARGEIYTIRPIRPEDAEAHTAFVRRVPQEDLRFRFFTALREVAPEQMARLTQIDYEREMAFIAVRARDGATVGVARLVREIGAGAGEFAVLIEPDAKHIGLASHLMRRIIAWGRAQGLARITGQVLADNHAMQRFVDRLGFVLSHIEDEPDVLEARLDIQADDETDRKNHSAT